MDFDFLRKEAINLTQQASGDRWTDYNFHDPGITILEQFCYALTDISYRTNMDVESLLFHTGDPAQIRQAHGFYPPEAVFPSGPITEEDYRVLLLDGFPNIIRNCWVDRIKDHGEGIRGLYNVTLLLHTHVTVDQHPDILREIRIFLCGYRNMCEDIDRITILEPVEVSVSADIDLFRDANAEEVLAKVLFEIEHYFNPMARFRTLEELELEGVPLEEAFDCTSHKHGFIDRKELRPRQQQYYVSRLGDYFTSVPGVKLIRNLSVRVGGVPVQGDILEVSVARYLTLGFAGGHFQGTFFDKSSLNIYKGGAASSYSGQTVINLLEILIAKTHRNYPVRLDLKPTRVSSYKAEDLRSYESVQKTFPALYGVGDFTPAQEDGPERQAQSAQLKAYLLLFDQLMANHLAQLTGISKLFTIHNFDPASVRSYFGQLVSNSSVDTSELLLREVPPKSEVLGKIEKLRSSGPDLQPDLLQEIELLEFDLSEKEAFSKKACTDFLKSLPAETSDRILRSDRFKNRTIAVLCAQLLDSFPPKAKKVVVGRGAKSLSEEQRALVMQVEELFIEEWMETPQNCPFTQRHLDSLMRGFDNASERKSRMLSHYLARFGESFRSDFQLRFTTLLEGEDNEKIARKMVGLKSAFLQEITGLARFRASGMNYLAEGGKPGMPLQRRLALQLNFEHDPKQRLTSAEMGKSIQASRVTKKEITSATRTDGKEILQAAQPSGKITFLVNGSDYYTYLFRFGVREASYSMLKEDEKIVVYFAPSNRHIPTKMFECASRVEAETRIRSVVGFLKTLNATQEGFHLLEHILLRPMNMDACRFHILGPEASVMFTSKMAKPRVDQQRDAFDTTLLGCYSTNYSILRNPQKEFVVVVKNIVGKELATASQTFMTELAAQQFVETGVAYFNKNKEAGTLDTLLQFDDENKFFFCLLDSQGELVFRGLGSSGLAEQEEQAREALICALHPSRFSIRQDLENIHSVVLTDADGNDLARSRRDFPSAAQAAQFIQMYIRLVEEARDTAKLVDYRRVHGRNAGEFNSQLSVVFPKWTSRFSDQDFLQLFIQSLHHAVPAHVSVNLIGLDYAEMHTFEDLYFKYLAELSVLSLENRATVSKLSNDLLDLISRTTTQVKAS